MASEKESTIWYAYEAKDSYELPTFSFLEVPLDEDYAKIFKSMINSIVLPVGFSLGRKETRSFEFYHPAVVARQFGFGQVPTDLFFANLVKPRGSLDSALIYDRLISLSERLLPPL